MLVELRKLRAKGGEHRSKANYIAKLQYRGIISTFVSEGGYVCYDTEELKKYKATVKIGRPIKERNQ